MTGQTEFDFDREIIKLKREKHRDDVDIRLRELRLRQADEQQRRWRSPLFVAALAGVLGLFGNAIVALINGSSERSVSIENARVQQEIADLTAEADRILEAIKTGDPDAAAENLKLLLQTNLVKDDNDNIQSYLDTRQPGKGASLPPNTGVSPYSLVTGSDERQLIATVKDAPYPALCHLRVTASQRDKDGEPEREREFFGTGFLVHPNLVLTSAYQVHSIYKDREYDGFAKKVEVFIGISKGQYRGRQGKYIDRVIVTNDEQFLIPPEWKRGDGNSKNFNFGAILVDRNESNIATDKRSDVVFALGQLNQADLKRVYFRISAYPRDPPQNAAFPEIWEDSGLIQSVDEHRLNYSIDTGDASSGAPIWRTIDGTGPMAIGVHTSSGIGRGIRFDEGKVKTINNWIKIAEERRSKN
ncbi:hypothetical protein [Novipirellula caenicola]|uniref:Serine protease n=1 Tax=Novipirellula caenicola TaxID=1536901 RepID=A0ABP9VS67_9BACT